MERSSIKYIPIKVVDRKTSTYDDQGKFAGYDCGGLLWTRKGPIYGEHQYATDDEVIDQGTDGGWWRAMLDDPDGCIGPFESLQNAMQEDAWKASGKHSQQQAQQLERSIQARGEYSTVGGKNKYVPVEGGRWALVPVKNGPPAQ